MQGTRTDSLAGRSRQRANGKAAPRIFAEMNTPEKVEKKGRCKGGRGRGREAALGRGTLPAVQDDSSTLSRVAVHCNERKHSAKQCSVSLNTLWRISAENPVGEGRGGGGDRTDYGK